jgi:small nuclear ribonucleoprotein (snRNP)-like protein
VVNKNAKNSKSVIVTTEHRGVFYGKLKSYDEDRRAAVLDNALMIIHFGTTQGLFQLAATGPTASSRLSAIAPSVRLEKTVSIIGVSAAAEESWTRR